MCVTLITGALLGSLMNGTDNHLILAAAALPIQLYCCGIPDPVLRFFGVEPTPMRDSVVTRNTMVMF
jgi:hypothetical protein